MRIDFTGSQLSNVIYGGSEKKTGIIFANQKWMLKYRKKTIYGDAFNDVSEYLGSKIFALLGFQTQEVLLGTYNGQYVVACKDFISNNQFTPFNDVGESSLDDDESKYSYSYIDICKLINKNKKIDDKKTMVSLFWETYIVDALIANGDRHGKNWGFLKKDNKYYPSPIFDNGNSLFAMFSDEEEMEYILSSKEELEERVYETPRSIIKNDKGLNDYYTVISSKQYEECNSAILKIVPLINLDTINSLIDSVDISDTRKRFLKTIIKMRYDLMLLKTYKELVNETN